jgi:hypothetical protein
VVVATVAARASLRGRSACARRTAHARRRWRRLVGARQEWRSSRRQSERCGEGVFRSGLMAADGGRTKPADTASERCAVQMSVCCEVKGSLRRWDLRFKRTLQIEQSRALSERSLRHAVDEAVRVGAHRDGDIATDVDAGRRSVNDARCRWQGVSELPAIAVTRRRGRDSVAIDLDAVGGMRWSRRSGDAGVGSVDAGRAGGRHVLLCRHDGCEDSVRAWQL